MAQSRGFGTQTARTSTTSHCSGSRGRKRQRTSCGYGLHSLTQIPADVSATMGPQEIVKCRQIAKLLVPVVKAGEQCSIECRASALRALGRLGEFPGVSDSLVEAGTVDMVASVIRAGTSSGQDPSFLKSSLSLLRTVLAGDSPAVSKARVCFEFLYKSSCGTFELQEWR